jgi:hypothetical protein
MRKLIGWTIIIVEVAGIIFLVGFEWDKIRQVFLGVLVVLIIPMLLAIAITLIDPDPLKYEE